MKRSATALLFCCLALSLAACGGGGEDSSTSSSTQATTTIRGPQPPQGASALQREIHRTFQPPQADPKVEGSAQAIEAGEAACRGKTPLEVKEEFIGESDLSSDQRQALEQLARAEANPSGDFAAGQLAALVYEGTLEGTQAEYGYRGCVYALARGLVGRLGG
jgi:ABC-type glycerol-3-phosphate transport system substrate-binding protein